MQGADRQGQRWGDGGRRGLRKVRGKEGDMGEGKDVQKGGQR